MSYAKETSVSVEKSQEEIKSVLRRYGVDQFGMSEGKGGGCVQFIVGHLCVEMRVPFPDRSTFEKTPTGKKRTPAQVAREYDQDIKSRWRGLLLSIKAKLDSVERGTATIEMEFLAWMVMGNGLTVGEQLIPKLQEQASLGRKPSLAMLANLEPKA